MVHLHALQDGVEFVVALRLREPLQRLFFGRVVIFAHGLLPSLTIVRTCSSGYGATPSQRLVCEERTHQYRHGNDQERDGQVSHSPGAFRATTRGQGSERSESKPGHGVQRIAIDDRSDCPDEPQRRGYPHKGPEALTACSATSAHLLTFRVSGWNTVSISSSGLSRYSPKRLEELDPTRARSKRRRPEYQQKTKPSFAATSRRYTDSVLPRVVRESPPPSLPYPDARAIQCRVR